MDSNVPDLSVLSSARNASTRPHVPLPPSRWKTRVLLPVAVLAIFAGLMAYALRESFWPSTPVRVAPVVARCGGDSSGASLFQAAGWVEPDPFPINVPALTDGVVKEVLVLEGQTVKAGDVLARLVDDEAKLMMQMAEAELHHKRGHLQILNATQRAALAEWEHPIERERAVALAEGALAEAKAELARIPHDIATEEAKLIELEEQLRREDKAAEANAIPEFQRTQTRLKLNTQRAVLGSSRERKPALEAKVRQMEADVKATRENLRLRISEKRAVEESEAGVCEAEGQVKMMEIALAKAKLQLERTNVRSPADGVVMQRLTEPGGKLMMLMDDKSSAQVARLYDPKKLQVRVDVPLAEAARVGVGQEARITVEVLRERTFKGTVTRVVNEADIQKNTLQVKVALADPVPELKPEMLARVQFVAGAKNGSAKTTDQRLFAQENAIQKNGERGTVWIVDKGRGVALKRDVAVGSARMEGWIEVTQGLQPGDAVIVGDTAKLKDGQSVRIVEESGGASASETKGGAHGSH